ncbi:adhesin [Neisseria iguanae]|uniref:Adhesin n=2 Tax=Neisseria iguanae TaxID=90242 RepID=A0A2P7U215_9NEIS|nr:adhesin [Neisseria iguanae]
MIQPDEAREITTKVRQVTYNCSIGGRVGVTYGFDKQKYPTYAQARLGGKNRFLPINWQHSDVATDSFSFGDENTWTIGGSSLTLGSYHNSNVLILSPGSKISYKNCKVASIKKVKG